MNVPLFLLWLIVLVLCIVFIVINLQGIDKYREAVNITVSPISKECTVPLDELPDVADLPCCIVSGTTTASKFVKEINMVANPIPIYYIDACKGFCTYGYDNQINVCINGRGQEEFNNCIELTKPKNCDGLAMPVARSGSTYYYANSATNAKCANTVVCS